MKQEHWQNVEETKLTSLQRVMLHNEWLKKQQEDVRKKILEKKIKEEEHIPGGFDDWFSLKRIYLLIMESKKKNLSTIEEVTLIKIERKYNTGAKQTYYYNIKVSDIEELLLIETTEPLSSNIVGSSLKYKFNKDKTELIDFDII